MYIDNVKLQSIRTALEAFREIWIDGEGRSDVNVSFRCFYLFLFGRIVDPEYENQTIEERPYLDCFSLFSDALRQHQSCHIH